MQKRLAALIALLIVAAWQYRNNRPVFFLVVGTLFAAGPMLIGPHIPDRVLQSFALAWAACMVAAAIFAAGDLARWLKKKRSAVLAHGTKEHKS